MSTDDTPITIEEVRMVLKKYDGDPPQPGEVKDPAEIIVYERGQLTVHIIKKGAEPCP